MQSNVFFAVNKACITHVLYNRDGMAHEKNISDWGMCLYLIAGHAQKGNELQYKYPTRH